MHSESTFITRRFQLDEGFLRRFSELQEKKTNLIEYDCLRLSQSPKSSTKPASQSTEERGRKGRAFRGGEFFFLCSRGWGGGEREQNLDVYTTVDLFIYVQGKSIFLGCCRKCRSFVSNFCSSDGRDRLLVQQVRETLGGGGGGGGRHKEKPHQFIQSLHSLFHLFCLFLRNAFIYV